MYGDSEHPIGLRFEPKFIGGHVHVTVRCGPDGSRAKCGELVLRPEDWSLLADIAEAANIVIRSGEWGRPARCMVDLGDGREEQFDVLPTIVDDVIDDERLTQAGS